MVFERRDILSVVLSVFISPFLYLVFPSIETIFRVL